MPRFTGSTRSNTITFLSHHPSVHHYQSGKELNVFVFGEGVVKDKPSTFKILNNLNMMYKNVANSSEIFNSFCLRAEVLSANMVKDGLSRLPRHSFKKVSSRHCSMC